MMDLGIQGKTALVLGGSGGLGSAIATSLAREGVKVAIAGQKEEALAAVAKQITDAGGEVQMLAWDLGDLGLVTGHIDAVESMLGPVDILINNTGGPPPTTAAGQPTELWLKQFQAMVLSVISITDRVLPGMIERKWGRIITSTSSGVVQPIPNLGISNTLRSSLVGWSKTLSREVAKYGITANVIIPGRIATGRITFLDESRAKKENRSVEQVAAESMAAIPAGRYGEPSEYADAVTFLASERAAYITGTILRVDGGMVSSL